MVDSIKDNTGTALQNLLLDRKFYPAHVKLTESIGLTEAMVLQQHMYFQSVKGSNYYGIRSKIKTEFRLSIKIQRAIEAKLVALGFLTTTKKNGKVNYYTVNVKNVEKFTSYEYQKRVNIVDKVYTADTTNPVNRTSDKRALHKLNSTVKVLENTFNEFSENSLTRMKKKPKSRLHRPQDDEPVKKQSLADRTNVATGNNRPIPERTIRCIQYWNKYPELMTHRLEQGNPSKTIKFIATLLGQFFSGNFLDVVDIPKGFDDFDWFKKKPTFDDFCDIVDDFVYCIRSPECRPQNNGTKYSLAVFLKGNSFITNGGSIPSLMLSYCFGDYKTVVEDKHPRTTMELKKVWLKHVGKFTDTPGTEKAFVLTSNLCHTRYEQKREEEKDWIPAMNDYKPVGIARNIIINKSDWFKKERKTPEIMESGFFANLVRRYDYDKKTGKKII